MKLQPKRRFLYSLLFVWFIVFVFTIIPSVSAGDISKTVPQSVADAIFGGNITLANVSISMVFIASMVMLLSAMHVKLEIQLVLMILGTGLLTGIGWLDAGFFIFILILILLIFSMKIGTAIFQ